MPRDDDPPRAYSSRLRIVFDGIPLSRDDPRVPDSLRDVLDEGPESSVDRTRSELSSGTWLDREQTAHLFEYLTPLLDDLASTGAVLPFVRTRSWREDPDEIAALISDGSPSAQGVFVDRSLPHAERLAALAEQVQEWEIEALWAAARPATWPQCPQHPDTHPLAPLARPGHAWWHCPVTGQDISPIGRLGRP
jgi:hypothetical protein